MRATRSATARPARAGWAPLALLLGSAGVGHLVRPRTYEGIVPRALGAPRPWVLWSGVAELACAAGLALPVTRRPAARATAVLFVLVFPANATMAVRALRSPRAGAVRRVVSLVRLPLQVPLVRWALAVAAAAPAAGAAPAAARAGRGVRR